MSFTFFSSILAFTSITSFPRFERFVGRRFLFEWGATACLGVALVLLCALARMTASVDHLVYDAWLRLQTRPASSDIVMVEIDNASIQALGRWPWPRRLHAELVDKLASAGASAIVYDVLFTEPSSDDATFARALGKRPTYLPILLTPARANGQRDVQMPVAPLAQQAAGLGHINLEVDSDGIVRSVALFEGDDHSRWPQLMVPVWRAIDRGTVWVGPGAQTGRSVPGTPARTAQEGAQARIERGAQTAQTQTVQGQTARSAQAVQIQAAQGTRSIQKTQAVPRAAQSTQRAQSTQTQNTQAAQTAQTQTAQHVQSSQSTQRARSTQTQNTQTAQTAQTQTAQRVQRVQTTQPPPRAPNVFPDLTQTSGEARALIPFDRAAQGYQRVSFADVLADRVPLGLLRNRVVVVGVTASGLYDLFATPLSGELGPLSGAYIHANILDMLLRGTSIEPAPTYWVALASLALVLVLLAGLPVLSPLRALLLLVVLGAVACAGSAALLLWQRVWLTPAPVLVALVLVYPVWSWRRLEMTMAYLRQELRQLASEPYPLPQAPVPALAAPAARGEFSEFGGDPLAQQMMLMTQAAQRVQDMRRFVWDSLDSVPEPILVADQHGAVLIANHAARAHFTCLDKLVGARGRADDGAGRNAGHGASRDAGYGAGHDVGRDAGHGARHNASCDARYGAGHNASRDAGHDAGHNTGRDAGHGAGHNAGRDSGHDARHSASCDARYGAGHNASRDAGHDAGHNAGRDEGYGADHDVGRDAGHDAGHNASCDARYGVGHNTGHDAGHGTGHNKPVSAGRRTDNGMGHNAGHDAGRSAGNGAVNDAAANNAARHLRMQDVFSGLTLVKTIDPDPDVMARAKENWPALLDPARDEFAELMARGIEVRGAGHANSAGYANSAGDARDYVLRYARCTNARGQAVGWIAGLFDVSALRDAERQREDALRVLLHDMRLPQASILALIETGRKRGEITTDAARDLLERIERYARRALTLADDFVQLARAESQVYSFEPANLAELLIDASDEVWPQAHAKRIQIDTRFVSQPGLQSGLLPGGLQPGLPPEMAGRPDASSRADTADARDETALDALVANARGAPDAVDRPGTASRADTANGPDAPDAAGTPSTGAPDAPDRTGVTGTPPPAVPDAPHRPPAAQDVAGAQAMTRAPRVADATDISGATDALNLPGRSGMPGASRMTANAPGAPNVTNAPATKDAADTADMANTASATSKPDVPDTASATDKPDAPDAAGTTGEPDAANAPDAAGTAYPFGAAWVRADRSLMARAFVNVLNNAIKYSPPNTQIMCTIRVVSADASTNALNAATAPAHVVCSIRDQGYGIALEDQARLFEPFRRFHTECQPQIEGAGLGMAFVKTVVARHGGDVSVRSQPGKGTTLTISLPALEQDASPD